MQVKCEYCGNYLQDTVPVCPNCGGVNEHYKRAAQDTPHTIRELQAWYEARNLPPYETTRFFIGVNCLEPKAFGIYQDGPRFVVYKNKADGTRAIRYEGTDEAYAVNELYMRLKEEILNQKSHNQELRERNAGTRNGKGGKRSVPKGAGKRGRGCLGMFSSRLLILIVILAMGFAGMKIDEKEAATRPENDAYYYRDGVMYYVEIDNYTGPVYQWWKYDEAAGEFSPYQKTEEWDRKHPELSFADDLDNTIPHERSHYELYYAIYGEEPYNSGDYNAFQEKYDIEKSHAYIDKHHHNPYSNGYYVADDKLYYYLNDSYTYDGQEESGWYAYEDNSWTFCSDGSDRESLGDSLWYNDEDCYIGDTFEAYTSGNIYQFDDGDSWQIDENAFAFEETDSYKNYLSAQETHDERIARENAERAEDSDREDSSYWSSTDDDYDWDSGSDSWDSGYSDWDSDW